MVVVHLILRVSVWAVPLFAYKDGDRGVAQPDDRRIIIISRRVVDCGTDDIANLDLVSIHDFRYDVAGIEECII